MKKIQISNACIINAGIEENGYQGGDAGHGGFVQLLIENKGGFCFKVKTVDDEYFELLVQGDAERDVLIESLEFWLKELKDDKYNVLDLFNDLMPSSDNFVIEYECKYFSTKSIDDFYFMLKRFSNQILSFNINIKFYDSVNTIITSDEDYFIRVHKLTKKEIDSEWLTVSNEKL